VTLEQLKTSFGEGALGTMMLRPSTALSRLPFVHLTADDARRARHGMEVKVTETGWADGEKVRMCDVDDHLIAVGDYDATAKHLHPSVVFV
jgi:tRNA U55 pseudouridine synthase TruB